LIEGPIGIFTRGSAMWSPAVKANIAMGMIKSEFLKSDIMDGLGN